MGHISLQPHPATHQVLLPRPAGFLVSPAIRYQQRETEKRLCADAGAPHCHYCLDVHELCLELYKSRNIDPCAYGFLRHSLTGECQLVCERIGIGGPFGAERWHCDF
jgi:hypothetical protein